MRVEVKFNVDFNMEEIMSKTNKSIEEFREFIDSNLCDALKYEFEEEGLVSIGDVKATYISETEE